MWTLISRLHILRKLWRDGRLTWRLFRDPRTPLRSKLILIGTVLLVISPINWIPNLIPVLGQLEDIALLSLGMEMFLRSVPGGLRAEHEARLKARLKARLRRPDFAARCCSAGHDPGRHSDQRAADAGDRDRHAGLAGRASARDLRRRHR